VATVRLVFASVMAWTVGAMAAVGVGLLALSLIGDGLSTKTGQPLTPDAVAREASSARATPTPSEVSPRQAAPSASASSPGAPASRIPASTQSAASPAPAARSTDRLVTTSGGTAIVRCTESGAYLVSWSPNAGYRFDNVERGPADRVRVRFRSDDHKVELRATCVRGVPEPRIEDDRG
jgi:hypothetical protein